MITLAQECKFNVRWLRLAQLGQCDGLGGAEYRRVKAEWDEAGCPPLISLFIIHNANRDSAGRGPLPRLFTEVRPEEESSHGA